MQHLYAHAASKLSKDSTAKYNVNNYASIGRFRYELWSKLYTDLVNM